MVDQVDELQVHGLYLFHELRHFVEVGPVEARGSQALKALLQLALF